MLVAVTAPGVAALPWDPDLCELQGAHGHDGRLGCRCERETAREWNETASERYALLWKAASIAADRFVRRVHGPRVRLPRRVAVVWSAQRRGVWHVHEALPFGSHVERQWSRLVVAYLARRHGEYGWGRVDRNPLREGSRTGSGERAARYLARNAAGYLAENLGESSLPGRRLRSYVSRRLTSRTGCTIRNLRRVRWLYVCLRLGLPLPEWPADQLEVVWRLLVGADVAAQGP